MSDLDATVDAWIANLPEDATSERVHQHLWYVRIPGVARRWIPIEIEASERSVKLTSHVIIDPEERQADVYKFLLRHNHDADGLAFSFEGREGVICLVTRVRREELTTDVLDRLVGRIVERTEETFRSILSLGFGKRLRRGS